MRFPKETDINISINASEKTNCPEFKRREIAEHLFALCKDKKLINVARRLASCPICKKHCTFVPAGDVQAAQFPDSSILDEREGFDLIVPIEMIHILSDHPDVEFDLKIMKFYASIGKS